MLNAQPSSDTLSSCLSASETVWLEKRHPSNALLGGLVSALLRCTQAGEDLHRGTNPTDAVALFHGLQQGRATSDPIPFKDTLMFEVKSEFI